MHGAGSPPTQPHDSIGVDEQGVRTPAPDAPKVPGVLTLCLASFGVMVPWPLLAILITHSHFDNWNEASLLFGGITGIPIAILTIVGLPPALLPPLLVLLWVAAAVVPDIWLARRLSSRRAVLILLGAQTAFSFAQAVMGALMIFGKAV